MPPIIDKDALEQYIEQYLGVLGYELVDLGLELMGHQWLISAFIDKPESAVAIRDCQIVNDKLKLVLEADKFANIDFRLIVSSPGLDRIVKKPADFQRFLGRKVKVQFPPSEGAKKGRTVEGILEQYNDGTITLTLPGGEALEFLQNETKIIRLVPEISFTPNKAAAEAAEDEDLLGEVEDPLA